jgi:hypothetical protein
VSLPDLHGAMVTSPAFDGNWGIRDSVTRKDVSYRRLPAARRAVRDTHAVFASTRIRANRATVGFLSASTRDDLHAFMRATKVLTCPELDPCGNGGTNGTWPNQRSSVWLDLSEPKRERGLGARRLGDDIEG